jgi:signal transduction histidine kinase
MQAKERLAAAGELAAPLAHEIRNPLGSISGAAQMLMSDGDVSEDRQRLLSIIRRESQRLAASLEQFLGQARATARPSGPIDLGGVFDRAVTLLRTGLSQERHTVSFERDQGPHVCIADPDAMTQVFWNLARNGLEAMPSGGTLAISLRRERDDVVLRVQDDGRGLAERDARLFEPFVSRSPMGTGLGLAIVYRIVQSHGGDIVLRNRPGHGTEAEVRLPAARAAQDERAGAQSVR